MPQVAILSLDAVQKRPMVVATAHGDAIAARPVAVRALLATPSPLRDEVDDVVGRALVRPG